MQGTKIADRLGSVESGGPVAAVVRLLATSLDTREPVQAGLDGAPSHGLGLAPVNDVAGRHEVYGEARAPADARADGALAATLPTWQALEQGRVQHHLAALVSGEARGSGRQRRVRQRGDEGISPGRVWHIAESMGHRSPRAGPCDCSGHLDVAGPHFTRDGHGVQTHGGTHGSLDGLPEARQRACGVVTQPPPADV